jgi:hypothetical protein
MMARMELASYLARLQLRVVSWELGAGSWALRVGRWELGAGSWALGVGRWEVQNDALWVRSPSFSEGNRRRPLVFPTNPKLLHPYRTSCLCSGGGISRSPAKTCSRTTGGACNSRWVGQHK